MSSTTGERLSALAAAAAEAKGIKGSGEGRSTRPSASASTAATATATLAIGTSTRRRKKLENGVLTSPNEGDFHDQEDRDFEEALRRSMTDTTMSVWECADSVVGGVGTALVSSQASAAATINKKTPKQTAPPEVVLEPGRKGVVPTPEVVPELHVKPKPTAKLKAKPAVKSNPKSVVTSSKKQAATTSKPPAKASKPSGKLKPTLKPEVVPGPEVKSKPPVKLKPAVKPKMAVKSISETDLDSLFVAFKSKEECVSAVASKSPDLATTREARGGKKQKKDTIAVKVLHCEDCQSIATHGLSSNNGGIWKRRWCEQCATQHKGVRSKREKATRREIGTRAGPKRGKI